MNKNVKREIFVVRTCGCHRGSSEMDIFTAVVIGRPAAVMVAERIGNLTNRAEIGTFLDGHNTSRVGAELIVYSSQSVPMPTRSEWHTHFAMVLLVDEDGR